MLRGSRTTPWPQDRSNPLDHVHEDLLEVPTLHPRGLTPQVYIRVLILNSSWVHTRGILLLLYLDDWLIASQLD